MTTAKTTIISLFLFFSSMLSLAQEPLFIVQENHSGLISALDISLDGKWFTTTGYDKQVRIWDMETGLLVQGFALYDVPNDIQFQEDRNYIYVGTHGITTAPLIALNMYNYGIQAGNQSSVYSFDRSKSFAFQAIGHNQGYISFLIIETTQVNICNWTPVMR
jgi:WD40 repeat protein